MPRIARIVVPDVPHHFTQRGNNRQQVFFNDGDRQQYLAFLAEEAAAHGLEVWAYCLMSNQGNWGNWGQPPIFGNWGQPPIFLTRDAWQASFGGMPRIARIVVPDVPHHFTQRGNNRQQVFFNDGDRQQYLAFLAEEAAAHGLEVWAYCLMSNHVHLIATPRNETAAARAIGRTHFRYSQYLNRRRGRCGHLWQGRFFSVALDEPHFWAAAAYVERNPVRARLVRKAWLYPWSSAAAHTSRGRDELLDLGEWRKLAGRLDWESVLAQPQEEELVRVLRSHSRTGRPLGSELFLARLEAHLGGRVRALPVGRPRRRGLD